MVSGIEQTPVAINGLVKMSKNGETIIEKECKVVRVLSIKSKEVEDILEVDILEDIQEVPENIGDLMDLADPFTVVLDLNLAQIK
jgi:hypothetical protein